MDAFSYLTFLRLSCDFKFFVSSKLNEYDRVMLCAPIAEVLMSFFMVRLALVLSNASSNVMFCFTYVLQEGV